MQYLRHFVTLFILLWAVPAFATVQFFPADHVSVGANSVEAILGDGSVGVYEALADGDTCQIITPDPGKDVCFYVLVDDAACGSTSAESPCPKSIKPDTVGACTNCCWELVDLATETLKILTSIELGHATDTTIVRSGAGDITVEGKGVYRADGTDVPVADGGTGSSSASTALVALGLNATAAEINTPLDGASVLLAEFQQLETIGASTISALQWALLGGLDATLLAAELNQLDGMTMSGSDVSMITGTAGTSTYAAVWNADGDLVDGPGVPQVQDAELDTIAALTETNGAVIFAAGGAWTADTTPALDCTDCTNIPGGGGGETLAQTLAIGADGNDVDMTSLGKLEFFDAGLYLDADADGVMDLTSDGTLELHSADWDIGATGAITGVALDCNGAGNTCSNVDVTADVTGILPTANGGTGIAYFTAAGPTVARVYTFPDAAATVMTGTAGTSTYAAVWDASGYLVDGPGVPYVAASATTGAEGLVELATNAETVTGTATGTAVTPDGLTARLEAPGEIGGTTPGVVNGTSFVSAGSATPGWTFQDTDDAAGTAYIYGNSSGGANDVIMSLGVEDSTGESTVYVELDGVTETVDLLKPVVVTGNIGATTYGSDGTISDAELLTLDNCALTEAFVGGGAGSAPVCTTVTGTGAPVLATSPTLVTPLLGTPTSGVLTNCTGLPSGGITSIVDTIVWDAAGITADGTQCADPAKVQINSGPRQYTIICTDNDASFMFGHVLMPDSWDAGTVSFSLEYLQTAADTDVLNADVECQCHGHGETVDNTWSTSPIAIDDAAVTGSNAVDVTDSAAVTCAGTCAAGDSLWWRIGVDAGGTTTGVATLHFLGVAMEYTSTVGD